MSENTTVDVPAVRVIHITSKDEFVKVATEYGITVGERGSLPKRALFAKVLNDIVAGTVKLIPTDFLNPSVQNTTPREKKDKPDVSYIITYKMVTDGKPSGDDLTLTLDENATRSYLPYVKGQVGFAYATMVLALHNADDKNSIGDLIQSYAVTDVERVETFPVAKAESDGETTDEAPKGEDTGEKASDADKAPETVEEVKADEDLNGVKGEPASGPNLVTPEADVPVVSEEVINDAVATSEAVPPKPARTRKTATAKAKA